jgi:hypothetical protein
MRTGIGFACLVVATLFLFIGLGLCLWGAYLGLTVSLGSAGAAALIGVVALVLAGGLVWIAIHLSR